MSTFVLVDDTDEMAQQRAKDILDEGVSDQFSSIQTSRMTAGLIGSPETVARRLKAYEDIGIDLVLMKFYATRGDIERIAKDALSIYKRL